MPFPLFYNFISDLIDNLLNNCSKYFRFRFFENCVFISLLIDTSEFSRLCRSAWAWWWARWWEITASDQMLGGTSVNCHGNNRHFVRCMEWDRRDAFAWFDSRYIIYDFMTNKLHINIACKYDQYFACSMIQSRSKLFQTFTSPKWLMYVCPFDCCQLKYTLFQLLWLLSTATHFENPLSQLSHNTQNTISLDRLGPSMTFQIRVDHKNLHRVC